MLAKNKEKKERSARRQSFVGVRPARFKKKTAYDRKSQKADTRKQILEDQFCPRRDTGIFILYGMSPYLGIHRYKNNISKPLDNYILI